VRIENISGRRGEKERERERERGEKFEYNLKLLFIALSALNLFFSFSEI